MADDYQKTEFKGNKIDWDIADTQDILDVAKWGTAPALAVQNTAHGLKYDANKTPLELLSPIALNEIGKVLAFGAKKYDSHNWRKGLKWSRVAGAAMRHLLAWLGGENVDPESGISHLAHLGCCVMFLLEYETTHKELDDRWKP